MYCQLSDVKEALDIKISADYDARINEYISVASDWIDQHCMYSGVVRPFEIPAETTRHYTSDDVKGRTLHTDVPFISISSVVDGGGTTIDSTRYRLMPRNHPRYYRIQLKYNQGDFWFFRDYDAEITVTGKFGYSETPPQPVVEACRHLAGWMHQRWQSGLNTTSATTELGTIGQVTDVPKHVITLLEPYVERQGMF
ncbi:MAG: phage head-tail connector protein [Chloroflexota bacterium]